MEDVRILYHGSERIVEHPTFGLGRKHNDFGLGFYCTEEKDLAKEWAVSALTDGFCNRYRLDLTGMNVLRLNDGRYSILNWIAVLVDHRLFDLTNPSAARARADLIERFGLNVNA